METNMRLAVAVTAAVLVGCGGGAEESAPSYYVTSGADVWAEAEVLCVALADAREVDFEHTLRLDLRPEFKAARAEYDAHPDIYGPPVPGPADWIWAPVYTNPAAPYAPSGVGPRQQAIIDELTEKGKWPLETWLLVDFDFCGDFLSRHMPVSQ